MKSLKKLPLYAMLVAMTCVATMISLPIGANGYIHIGDGVVLTCAYLLSPLGAGVCAAIGSAMADLLLGYAVYAPATFVIKLLDAMLASVIFIRLKKNGKIPTLTALLVSGICGGCVMILGYFLHAWLLLGDGFSSAITSIPPNSLQALAGVVLSTLLYKMISSHKSVMRFFDGI